MSTVTDWEIWSQVDQRSDLVPEKIGMRFTSTRQVAHEITQALRMQHYYESREWVAFYALEQEGPIRSNRNPILAEFRQMVESIIDPYLPKEAAWWLNLIQDDPLVENPNYWGWSLVDSVDSNPEIVDQAVRVLNKIVMVGKAAKS